MNVSALLHRVCICVSMYVNASCFLPVTHSHFDLYLPFKEFTASFFFSFNENSVYIKMHVLKSSRSGVSFVNVSYEMTDHADSDEERLRRLKNGRNSERQ